MKKNGLFAVLFTGLALSLNVSANDYISRIVSFNPAMPVDAGRLDEGLALGEEDDEFVSLGKGGSIIVEFESPVNNGSGGDLRVFETTYMDLNYAKYPESASVYGSNNLENWTYLGEAKNDNGAPELGMIDLGILTEARFIKLIDSTTWANSSDGFELDAIKKLH